MDHPTNNLINDDDCDPALQGAMLRKGVELLLKDEATSVLVLLAKGPRLPPALLFERLRLALSACGVTATHLAPDATPYVEAIAERTHQALKPAPAPLCTAW